MKSRADIIVNLALCVASGTDKSLPLLWAWPLASSLTSRGFQVSREPGSFPHDHPEMRIDFRSSPPLPFWFQGAGEWRDLAVDGACTRCRIMPVFPVSTIPHRHFRGNQSACLEDQSVREIKVLLFPLLISLSIFIKPFRDRQDLQHSFLQKERFGENCQFPALPGH